MPMHHTLLMQHIPYNYFNNMVQDSTFQPVKAELKDTSHTTTILLVFISADQLTCIEYIHTGLDLSATLVAALQGQIHTSIHPIH